MMAPAATAAASGAKGADVAGLFVADKEASTQAQVALANSVKEKGVEYLASVNYIDSAIKALQNKKDAAAREAGAASVSTLCENGAAIYLEPYVANSAPNGLFAVLCDTMGDKEKGPREAATTALKTLAQSFSPAASGLILPVILETIANHGKWTAKAGALAILQQLITSAPAQMAAATPLMVPVVSDAVHSTKSEVAKAAKSALKKICTLCENPDIVKLLPALQEATIDPTKVPDCLTKLSATTFVAEVTSPTLALISPLLVRALDERLTAIKRRACVVADNMSKLVGSEYTVRPFLPELLPRLIKTSETISDPEARSVCNRAIATLRRIGRVPADQDGSNLPPLRVAEGSELATDLVAALKKSGLNADASNHAIAYAGLLAASLVNAHDYTQKLWEATLPAYLKLALPESADVIPAVQEVMQKKADEEPTDEVKFDDEEEGEDLCNIEQFNLAYGAKILLHHANLRLKRGHRYGLLGRNGTGKSTLMNAIVNNQVEGFPDPSQVRTFYVQHDIDGSEETISIKDWVLSDKRLDVSTPEEIISTLESVGFDAEKQTHSIGSLSGGWKMKLALARAILFKADILLLDEPTNHLDVVNVTWLIDYLTSLTTCTSIMVSHDSDFLNRTITDVLHINNFKLKRYPGNLEKFVEHVPEARSYFALDTGEDYKFKLPDPPLLDGVKTKEKSLLKMRDVSFQYPGAPVQQLYGINLQVSLSSRVAILGPNGSGKSTLVKLLTGETEPNKGGTVWKHPNLVIGYVAQHAFHHIDQHLDSTPLEYMLWRYQTGEDLEELSKATRVLTEEEKKKMAEGSTVLKEGVKRTIDELVARKKLKQSYEYEVSFKGLSSAEYMWMSRDELVSRGFEKKVMELDTKEAQRLGLMRPLVRREIEKHFADFGLESEFVSHNSMRGLSGGQKVKVVLGAATWRRPHVICLDEPTNYLDRESLAALIAALKEFEGGVLIITHNAEFSEGVCSEVWAMREGYLEASGHNWTEGQGNGPRIDKVDPLADEEVKYDALGNPIASVKKEKKKSSAELRKAKKDRMLRRKRGEEVFTDEEL